MAHREQFEFVRDVVRASFPQRFRAATVLEFGSRIINGSCRQLFTSPWKYVGVDAAPGDGVDVVSLAHEFDVEITTDYDVVFSCEMLEHDPHYDESLKNMARHVAPGGLFFGTAAGPKRREHGTPRTSKPGAVFYGPRPEYYRNIMPADVLQAFNRQFHWSSIWVSLGRGGEDIYWYGVKER